MSKLFHAQSKQGNSPYLFNYIKSRGTAKSWQEEERMVLNDLKEMRGKLTNKNKLDNKQLKEIVVRVIYAELTGVSAEFAHIQCVNLASDHDILCKRIGYLASSLCISSDSELMFLLVASIQRDLKSTSVLDICAGLTACRKLLPLELINAVNNDVVYLLSHSNALVRKKAVLAMQTFYRRTDGAVGDIEIFHKALCDKDLSVVGASLHLLYDVCLNDPAKQQNLLPSLASIMNQILQKKLPREFSFHKVPAPWIQIRLLKLMTVLIGTDNYKLAEQFKCLIMSTLKCANTNLIIGYAIVLEVINTITTIPPQFDLLDAAVELITAMFKNGSPNMCYMGLIALTKIVKINPVYARNYQQLIMNCLENNNDSIRRGTIKLLLALCNENNLEAILGRIIRFLAEGNNEFDENFKRDLTRSLCVTATRFNTGAKWFVDTINVILELNGDDVPRETLQEMLKVIKKKNSNGREDDWGEKDCDDGAQNELQQYCVEVYFEKMSSLTTVTENNILLQVAAWVIGEYGHLVTGKYSYTMLSERLCDMLDRTCDPLTKSWIITAMAKLIARAGSCSLPVLEELEKLKHTQNVGLQQKCYELLALATLPDVMKDVFLANSSCEEIKVDPTMSFLQGIVARDLASGGKPYDGKTSSNHNKFSNKSFWETLRTEAYAPGGEKNSNPWESLSHAGAEAASTEVSLNVPITAKRWGIENLEEIPSIERLEDVVGPPSRSESRRTLEGLTEVGITSASSPSSYTSEPNVQQQELQQFSSEDLLKERPRGTSLQITPGMHLKPQRTETEKFMDDILGGASKKKKKRLLGTPDSTKPAQYSVERSVRNVDQSSRGASSRDTVGISEATDPLVDLFPGARITVNHNNKNSGYSATPTGVSSSFNVASILSPHSAVSFPDPVVQGRIDKLLDPDCLKIRIGVLPSAEIRDVKIKLVFSPPGIVSAVSCNAPQKDWDSANLSMSIPVIPPKVACFVEFQFGVLDYLEGGLLGALVTYLIAPGKKKEININTPILVRDVLRPAELSKNDYLQWWAKLAPHSNDGGAEAVCVMNFSQEEKFTPEMLHQHLKQKAQFKLLAVTSTQCFAASSLVGCNFPILCQMTVDHCTVKAVIRGKRQAFIDTVASQLSSE